VLDRANAQDEKARDETFLNHPKGLFALFNLEVWERFSFLGFNAILALYLSDAVSNGGLGYNENIASSVVATYGALVYLLAVGGAWIADRASGARLALLWGAIIIACGHIFMSIPAEYATWVGLTLIIAGTGFLKPNVSSMVGDLYLYKNREQRRDAGFAIYYAGINLGAFLGPLIAGSRTGCSVACWFCSRCGGHDSRTNPIYLEQQISCKPDARYSSSEKL
jgi:POT family proton-dependent oligopeptide transporter